MDDSEPTPPELPPEVISVLDGCSPSQLREIADYAGTLARYRERQENADGAADGDGQSAERPTGVPSKATLTTKKINGNRYHYWQWRDGDKIRSKYEGPADG